jgi:hypothetical protein
MGSVFVAVADELGQHPLQRALVHSHSVRPRERIEFRRSIPYDAGWGGALSMVFCCVDYGFSLGSVLCIAVLQQL